MEEGREGIFIFLSCILWDYLNFSKEYNLTLDHIYDEDLNEIEAANHPKQVVKVKYDKELPKNSMMRVNF